MPFEVEPGFNAQGELYGPGAGAGQKHPSRGSRAEFEKFFAQVPDHIKAELRLGKLRLGDEVIYSLKPVGGAKTVKLFETQDDKKIGFRNISNAKLPKNQALLVSGIYLLAGTATAAVPGSPTDDEVQAIAFDSLSAADFANIANGEFSLKANKVQLVPETSNRVFVTDNNAMMNLGYYKLDNPRLIHDDVLIEFTVELGSTATIPQDTYIWVGLDGTITTP